MKPLVEVVEVYVKLLVVGYFLMEIFVTNLEMIFDDSLEVKELIKYYLK
jgi:hypothetical protein